MSCTPSNQVDSPSWETCAAISTASSTAPISIELNSIASGNGPTTKLVSTSTGITNSAICALEPIAIAIAMSILSRAAKYTATQCSAALPTTATMISETKNGDSPIPSDASSIEPTRISDITPTATPAPASTRTLRRTLQASSGVSSSVYGLKTSWWVRSENHSPAKYESSSTIATANDMCSTSAGKFVASSSSCGN